ncbi:MAG: enoyl-CoA hydratase/isomerase family protein [Hyphomicrobiaceae bacterium]|nr:enoyl-CoA hydratase/isomerase family protein [Hyphomicrobiaceae bacterium]
MDRGGSGGQEPPASASGTDIVAATEGAAGVITLDRPRALNALTAAMRATIGAAFAAWARDPQIYAAVIVSATDRAFCAGGDVREMVECGRRSLAEARRMLASEYALNWQLDCFIKPTVALIDGAVMGSGVGVTLYGTHRVAGERYRFAMPETSIGLFPDDGVSWTFARLPDEIGMYLALTGRAVGRADAYRLGLATHCLSAAQFAEVGAALKDADPIDEVLDARHVDPGPGELDLLQPVIARCFGAPSVEAIFSSLQAERGAARTWAEGVLGELEQRSPTSLKVTYRAVRQAQQLDLGTTLQQDYRLACRFMEDHDFYEGVRAALVDRDHTPRWQPAHVSGVSDTMVAAYFAPLGADELKLTTRAQMQAVG